MALTKVSGHIIDQPFDVGIITATNQYVSGIGTFGNIRVLGDLQVDGTTTTLDTVVTEVDRLEVGANNNTVGLAVTQSGTGDIFNLYDGSTEVFSVADGGDVSIIDKIVHTGDTNTAIRFPAADTVTVETGGSERLRVTSAGKVGINEDNPETKLVIRDTLQSTASNHYSLIVKGDDNGTDGESAYIFLSAIDAFTRGASIGAERKSSSNDHDLIFKTSAVSATPTERLRITSDGKVRLPDDVNLTFGADDDMLMRHSGNDAVIENTVGHIYISNYTDDEDIYLRTDDGSGGIANYVECDGSSGKVKLSYYGTKKFETTSGGVNVTGELNVTTKVAFPDSAKAIFGASDDLQIYHNGTHNFIDATGPADLYVRGANILLQDHVNSNRNWLIGLANGTLELYHSGNKKLETTSGGVTVTGDVSVGDSSKVNFGDSSDGQIYYNQSNDIFYIYNNSAAGGTIVQNNSAAGGITLQPVPNENAVFCAPNGRVSLYYNNTEKFRTTTTGAKVTGALEVTQEYPSIRPTLDLNFAATKTLDRRITFTRDSLGTFIGEDGLLKYAPNNVPRFDHDPTTGESLGLLIEESRTNLLTNSNAPTGQNFNWNTVTTTDNVLTPDGRLSTVRRLTSSGSNNFTYRMGSTTAGSANTNYTGSVWIRTVSGTVTVTTDMNDQDGRTVSLSTDWVRFDSTATTPASGGSAAYRFFDIYTNTTADLYVWGAQIEAGSFPTSYIPTNGSTVTRAQDTAKITGTNFTDFYNQEEGTLVAHYYSTVDDGYLAQLESVTTPGDDRIGFVNYAGYQGFVETGNSTQASLDNGTPTVGAVNKVAFAFKTNDFAVSLNSATPVTDTSGTMPTVGRMMIGSRFNGVYDILKSSIRHLSYYPKRLPNSQLQSLTQQ
tara:strand:+ start:2121 stop:4796 length:2676 start_codon:yes stop_codon:yes gene_type:complete